MIRMLSLAGALVTCTTARADFIVVDTFQNPSPAASYAINPIAGPSVNPVVFNHSTGLNSNRTTTLTVNTPLPPNLLDLQGQLGGGLLFFNSSLFARAQANLFYDNFTNGANNFLAAGTPFRMLLGFSAVEAGVDVTTNTNALDMPVDVVISTTGGSLTGNFFLTESTTPIVYALPITNFTGIADLANVISVNVNFNGGPNQRQATDFVLTSIRFETFSVPAPPAALLALAGVPVVHIVRRRRHSVCAF
jgi:hypothetical protein